MTSHKEELEELKEILFSRLVSCPPGAVAGIAREYRQVVNELEELSPSKGEDETLDELSRYRAQRQATAGNRESPS
jgi:hypothetical protein